MVLVVLLEIAQTREMIQPMKVQPRKKLRTKMPAALVLLRRMAMMVGRKYGMMAIAKKPQVKAKGKTQNAKVTGIE